MTDDAEKLARTPLHALHEEAGARMVPFAGYLMPVQYPTGIIKEHQHTRAAAGLFDVSHMGQILLRGDDAARALETLVPVDVVDLGAGRQRYALFTNDAGGILDDLMVTNAGDHLYLVVNAACKHEDLAHLQQALSPRCDIEARFDRALIALQGPQAAAVLETIAPGASELVFMTARELDVAGARCFVSRSGYTGEDGFEIGMAAEDAETVARRLLADERVLPIGLGARDSLRLEAGLCLYGHDMDTDTSPLEASLRWALSPARRPGGDREGGYPGYERVAREFADGVSRRRVGLLPEGRAPVREGAELVDGDGQPIGRVTSGGFGPSISRPVAMGYVDAALAKPDTPLDAVVRGKRLPLRVARMPFVEQRYHRG